MNFSDQVSALIRGTDGLESLGQSLARVLDGSTVARFVFYSAPERCLVTIPYLEERERETVRTRLEAVPWRRHPEEAISAAIDEFGTRSETGGTLAWSFLGGTEEPSGVAACLLAPAVDCDGDGASALHRVQFFLDVAAEVSRLLKRTRRDDAQLERAELLRALDQLGSLVFLRPDAEGVLPSLLKVVLDVASAEVGSILVESAGELIPEVEWGLRSDLLQSIRLLPEDEGLLDRLRRLQEPIVIDDFSGPTVRVPAGVLARIACLICVPLSLADGRLGVLSVASGESGRELLPASLSCLRTLSVFIGFLLENARLRSGVQPSTQPVAPAAAGWLRSAATLRGLIGALDEAVVLSDACGAVIASSVAADHAVGRSSRTLPWLREQWAACRGHHECRLRLSGADGPDSLRASIQSVIEGGKLIGHITCLRKEGEGSPTARSAIPASVILREIEKPLAAIDAFLAVAKAGTPLSSIAVASFARSLERLHDFAADVAVQAGSVGGAHASNRELPPTAPADRSAETLRLPELWSTVLHGAHGELAQRRIALQVHDLAAMTPFQGDRTILERAFRRLFGAVLGAAAEEGWLRLRLDVDKEVARSQIDFQAGPAAAQLPGLIAMASGASSALSSRDAWGLAAAVGVVKSFSGSVRFEMRSPAEARLTVDLCAMPVEAAELLEVSHEPRSGGA